MILSKAKAKERAADLPLGGPDCRAACNGGAPAVLVHAPPGSPISKALRDKWVHRHRHEGASVFISNVGQYYYDFSLMESHYLCGGGGGSGVRPFSHGEDHAPASGGSTALQAYRKYRGGEKRLFPSPAFHPLESSRGRLAALFVLAVLAVRLLYKYVCVFIYDLPAFFLSAIRQSSFNIKFDLGVTRCFDLFFMGIIDFHNNSVKNFLGWSGSASGALLGPASSVAAGAVLLFFPKQAVTALFFHIIVIFHILSRIVSLAAGILLSLLRMFRGKHRNRLMNRTDSMRFGVDQLIMGALLFFAVLLFLENVVFYYLFLLGFHKVYQLGLGVADFLEYAAKDYSKYCDGLELRGGGGAYVVSKKRVGRRKVLAFALKAAVAKRLAAGKAAWEAK